MSQDRFTRRGRAAAQEGAETKEYDFSAIAAEAVAKTRAQSGDDGALPEAPRADRELPQRRPRGSGDGKALWDQPVSRDRAISGGDDAPRRSPFAQRRDDISARAAQADGSPDEPRRKMPGFVKLLPQSVTGRDRFDGSASIRDGEAGELLRKPDRPERKPVRRQWDETVRKSISDEDTPDKPRKMPFAFGKKAAREEQPADIWERPAAQDTAASADRPAADRQTADVLSPGEAGGHAFRAHSGTVPPAGSFSEGLLDDDLDDFGDLTGDVFSPPPPPVTPAAPAAPIRPEPSISAPPPPPAQPEEPQRRVFNAATQPNYGYMTDNAPAEPQQDTSVMTSRLAAIKASIASRMSKDEPGVEYYTPPADRAPSQTLRHQKRRNRRPWPMWLKAGTFGLCLAIAFFAILYVSFYTIITSRIYYVGDTINKDVYYSEEEMSNHKDDLTGTEENAAEFTEPLSFATPRENVKVIMVVSSDYRLGGSSQQNDPKATSAKTDAIMLMALDSQNRRIRIASIMTDTYVRIQNYRSNKLSKAYYYDTLNGDYTLSRLRQAVYDNFGVAPDNYVVVDFDALQILVERIGGVDIYVSADEAYYMSNHPRYGNFPRYNSEGPYNMSGSEALNYVRMRAVGNGDYDRVARQRKVFSQILVKLQDMSRMELAELAYSILPELPTDLTAGDVFSYLTHAADLASYEVTEVTFPITNSWRYGTATVRDDSNIIPDNPVSSSDVVSGSDISDTADKPTTNNKFTVIVTNFQFNATALQRYLYDNDESYLNGAAAVGVSIPEIIAPLESDTAAAGSATP